RGDRRVARRAVEQCEVAEERAWPERRHRLPVARDLALAVDDDEELAAGGALPDDQLPGVHQDTYRLFRHEREVLLRARGEEGDVGEVLSELTLTCHGRNDEGRGMALQGASACGAGIPPRSERPSNAGASDPVMQERRSGGRGRPHSE